MMSGRRRPPVRRQDPSAFTAARGLALYPRRLVSIRSQCAPCDLVRPRARARFLRRLGTIRTRAASRPHLAGERLVAVGARLGRHPEGWLASERRVVESCDEEGDLKRVLFEPYVAELRRWQRELNRVTELDVDPFSDPVNLDDIVAAADRLQLRSDKNWA